MKIMKFAIAVLMLLGLNDLGFAQGIMGSIQKVKNGIENASRNIKKDAERRQEEESRTNPQSVAKSDFHMQHVGKVLFAKGSSNAGDNITSVDALDLKTPSFMRVYLEDPLYNILAKHKKIGQYDVVSTAVVRKYYINDEFICEYSESMEMEDFKNKAVLSEVFVPADDNEFNEQKFKVGVIAHVLSTLPNGTHKFRIDYEIVVAHKVDNPTNEIGKDYEHKDVLVSSGEVKVNINKSDLDMYCKLYGRPKFSKGVLQSDAQLERTITDMIKADTRRTPIYIYANDNWTVLRGALDRVVGREVRVYYVFINDKGRAELADRWIKQDFDGRNYLSTKFTYNKDAPAFKYVCKQNY